jgi:hypothetical protein
MRRVLCVVIMALFACTVVVGSGDAVVKRRKSGTRGTGGSSGKGLIVSVSSGAKVSGRWQRADAYEGFALATGDSLTLEAGASVSGFKPTGEPFQVEGPVTLTFVDADPQFRNRIHDWTSRQISTWSGLGEIDPFGTPARHAWEAASVEASPMVPVDGGSVRPERSRFWWKKIAGVEKYEIEVTWQDGKKTRRIRKKVKRANRLVLEDLESGREYEWIVRTKEGKRTESHPNKFRVLTGDEKTILDEITYGLPDVMAGVLVLSAGLHEEAIQYFDAALVTDPQRRSALVWRSRAFAAVGRYEEAYRDLIDAMMNDVIEKDVFSESFLYDGIVPRREPR